MSPSTRGYDFHRSLRIAAERFLLGDSPIAQVIESTDAIQRASERNSARTGLVRLSLWRRQNPGAVWASKNFTFNSPNSIFTVALNPNFYIRISDCEVATHIWNTQRPPLNSRQVYAALSLFVNPECDLAVLSLRQNQLYRLSEAEDHTEIGRLQVAAVERTFIEIGDELGVFPSIRRDPPAPPSPNPI